MGKNMGVGYIPVRVMHHILKPYCWILSGAGYTSVRVTTVLFLKWQHIKKEVIFLITSSRIVSGDGLGCLGSSIPDLTQPFFSRWTYLYLHSHPCCTNWTVAVWNILVSKHPLLITELRVNKCMPIEIFISLSWCPTYVLDRTIVR